MAARLAGAAYAVTGDRELASDAAQDAFLRAAAALPRFDVRRPVEPWLLRIATNRALDLVRARRRLVAHESADEPVFDEPLLGDGLLASVARLDPDRRAVVALHYWLDLTTPEIAEVLGVPTGTVASRLSRALRDLRQALEAQTPEARNA